MQYIAFDAHKRYTYAVVEDPGGNRIMEQRIEHRKGELAAFLAHCELHSPVALETIGSWYWIVDEIEAADMVPKLVNARRAKMMLCSSKKTDRLDARGMNTLQRAGTLPTVWIPPGELRDIRELFRTRMVFKQQVTRLKNRILSCFST
jgi:transposase